MIEKVSLSKKFEQVTALYTPKEIATINEMSIKIAKVKGPFTWHTHLDSDEMFLVIKGALIMEIENQAPVTINENELIVIPKGVAHRPNPNKETLILLFEPSTLLNTGNIVNEFTVVDVEKI